MCIGEAGDEEALGVERGVSVSLLLAPRERGE